MATQISELSSMSLNNHAQIWNHIIEKRDEKTNTGKKKIFIKLSISLGLEAAKYETVTGFDTNLAFHIALQLVLA